MPLTGEKTPPVSWRVDPMKVHDVARLIARELPATIDGRTGNSDAHQRMHALYKSFKRDGAKSFFECAEDARAMWIADTLFEMLSD